MRQIWLTLAIAVGYFLLGILSLTQLHINSYVAGFWFPSGLVVALALQKGYWPLPGIFFGEMAIGGFFNQGPLWMQAGVALSQCVQAGVACWLGPRLLQEKNIFSSLGNLWRFLFIALVSSVVHTLVGGWLM
ncbi:MASE1 domain-containing protein, partial [Synechocystis salina LEGE 06155]|nr:MASE1 domain-containing protein [Synechocystis salina LEGE 06155]